MWGYYKCVNLIKVLIQGSKVILFSIENALQKTSRAGGAPPRTDALIGPAAFGDVQTGQLKRRGAFACSLSLPLATLWRSWTPARSNARKADLEAGPPDSLSTKPTIGGGLRPCQSRNGATKSTIAEESFPDDVTQPFQVSTREQPKEPELNTWRPKQRTPAGKRTNHEPALNPFKQVQTEIPNPDWTG